MSRTVRPSSRHPTSWRITCSRPSTWTLPAVRRLVAGDHSEQGGLARAVGADEGHVVAVAHPEAHVLQELGSVGRAARHPVHVDGSHGRETLPVAVA